MTDELLPAWSEPFVGARLADLRRDAPFGRLTRDWAIGETDGSGVTVAIIDSGVERDHPAVGGKLVRSVKVELALDPDDDPLVTDDPDGLDVVGHGTACAGIIHAIAPGADLVSVRVLGPDNRGKGIVFAAGLDWAIEQGASVVNLSLSSKSDALFGLFHDLADRAYFANVLLVCAANNVPGNSYPPSSRRSSRSRPTTSRTPPPGSTTRTRRWSSAPTGSTWTSPGATAAGWSRPATRLRRPTWPGTRRSSGPGIPPPRPSR